MNLLVLCSVLVACSSLCDAVLLVHNVDRKVSKILTVDNGGPYGDWGPPQFCADGSYAVGYNMLMEGYQGSGDDTELDGIVLRCETLDGGAFGGNIASHEGAWGSYTGVTKCDNQHGLHHFLTAFTLQVEPYQNSGDDTEANYIKFHCRDFEASTQHYEMAKAPGHGAFGTYGSWSDECDAGSAICGLATRIERPQGGGDDTGLNDVKMFCCTE